MMIVADVEVFDFLGAVIKGRFDVVLSGRE
jgi:hypothetical protein